MTPYEILDVDKKASKEEIKNVYRDKARALHPDHGGDEDAFKKIAGAYKLLSDTKRREKYDKDGIETDQSTIIRNANSVINNIFLLLIKRDGLQGVLKTDVVAEIKEDLIEKKKETKLSIEKAAKLLKEYDAIGKRIIHKNPNNILSLSVKQNILNIKNQLKALSEQREVVKLAIKLIVDFDFVFDKTESGFNSAHFMPRPWFGGMTTATGT